MNKGAKRSDVYKFKDLKRVCYYFNDELIISIIKLSSVKNKNCSCIVRNILIEHFNKPEIKKLIQNGL